MAKFDYKKWVVENKHGKLNEQPTPSWLYTYEGCPGNSNMSGPGAVYDLPRRETAGGPLAQLGQVIYTTNQGCRKVIDTGTGNPNSTGFAFGIYNSCGACAYYEQDNLSGSSWFSGTTTTTPTPTSSMDSGTGSATNMVTCYGCINGVPTPVEFEEVVVDIYGNTTLPDTYGQNDGAGFCGYNYDYGADDGRFFYSTDHHAFNNCPSTGSIDLTPTSSATDLGAVTGSGVSVTPPASSVTPPAFEDPCEKLKKEPKEKVMDFCMKCAQTNNMLDPLCKCCDKLGIKIDPKKLKMDPKTKALKEIIKRELRKVMQEQQSSYSVVGGFGSLYDDPFGAFDSSAWAQNFQTTKVASAQNPCNFIKNQRFNLISKMHNIPGCQGVPDCSNNKHWKRLQIKTSTMLVMLQQNGCPVN